MNDKNNKNNRREFLKTSATTGAAIFMGLPIVFASNRIPTATLIGKDVEFYKLPGKDSRLTILNDRPINAETPPHLLDEKLTPNNLFFVRNNGIPPKNIDKDSWTLTIEGESASTKKKYTLEQLKSKFSIHTLNLTLECGGNGRSEFNPPAKGNQWSLGAVGCAAFTGVLLRDVLQDVGLKNDAKYIGYYGKDTHLSGDPNKVVISRGVPIGKAMEQESMIAWKMNGENLPLLNGYPLRLVFGGWPASCSGKWLSRIVVRNKEHDGPKMKGQSYRVPCKPVPPGTQVPDNEMCIIESMPVKSIITYPKTGAIIKLNQILPIRGHSWAGDFEVKKMEYSIDFGSTWQACKLTAPENRHAWQHFDAQISFPKEGYYEVWARATDSKGSAQPMILPGWNPRGYLNNACHRIAIKVEG